MLITNIINEHLVNSAERFQPYFLEDVTRRKNEWIRNPLASNIEDLHLSVILNDKLLHLFTSPAFFWIRVKAWKLSDMAKN